MNYQSTERGVCEVEMYRTLIVDDSPVFLSWLGTTLADAEDFQVVGRAIDGADAIAQALEIEPDLLITDFFLPDMDGLEIANTLTAQLPNLKVIIISSHEVEVYAALEASDQITSFVPKSGLTVSALRNLLPGEAER